MKRPTRRPPIIRRKSYWSDRKYDNNPHPVSLIPHFLLNVVVRVSVIVRVKVEACSMVRVTQ